MVCSETLGSISKSATLGVLMLKFFDRILGVGREERKRRSFYQEWDYRMSKAMSPSERNEIDAIFRRASV